MKYNKNGELHKTKHAWHLINWDQPTDLIAAQLGIAQSTVSKARRKYAPNTVFAIHLKKSAMMDKWSEIDWNKTDSAIGKETGRSRKAVWSTRMRMGKQKYKLQKP